VTGKYALKLIDLFCGAGGFSHGAHSAGLHVAAAYDIDKILTSSFSRNFPNTKLLHRDVAILSGAEIDDAVGGDVAGIIGGPPCQGFSDIGRRSTEDPRRQLLGHFFRIVAEIEPYFFVMENVRGLAYPHALPVLEDALALVSPSYDILGPHILDAADFGAATKRKRLFVIGIHRKLRAPIDLAAIERFKRPAATVEAAISDIQDARCLSEDLDRWKISGRHVPSEYARALRAADNTFTGHKGTTHTQAVIERFASVKPGKVDPIGRHPRLELHGQCPTLRAGTGADKGSYQSVRPIHPIQNRVITVREAARLQGFPDSHVFHDTVWHSYRMIGNSVSPIIASVICTAIGNHLSSLGNRTNEAIKSSLEDTSGVVAEFDG